ncbi:hypothetical protein FRB97_004459, partial [Tulasnella sp. 331]
MYRTFVQTHWPKLVVGVVGCLLVSHLFELQSAFSGTYGRQLEEDGRSVTIRLEQPSQPIPTLQDIAFDGSWKEVNRTEFNRPYHEKLRACRSSSDGCAGNEGKLVLLALGHFRSVLDGATQGEDIWCDSFMDSLHALGYSMLIPQNNEELYTFWRDYHEQVQLIVWNRLGECQNLFTNNTCVQSDPEVPLTPPNATHLNIPLWKIFNMHFWNGPDHPYGSPFTLSPEDYSAWTPPARGRDNYYLGYSLERTCTKVPYVAHSSRPRQVYVYAKHLQFFIDKNYILRNDTEDDDDERLAKVNFFRDLSASANATFVAKMRHDVPGMNIPDGISELTHSMYDRGAFQHTVSSSRVLMGVGRPALSPTPWAALCLGVPFINVITGWDGKHPDDSSRWSAQQEAVFFLRAGEPFVYNVKSGDRLGLEEAIRKA